MASSSDSHVFQCNIPAKILCVWATPSKIRLKDIVIEHEIQEENRPR